MTFPRLEALSIIDAKTVPLFRQLRDRIFTAGAVLIRTGPTKHNISKPNTYLDYIVTNHPEKVFGQKVIRSAYYDHYPVTFQRNSNNIIPCPNYILARDYSLINWEKVWDELNGDTRLVEATISNSPDVISVLIRSAISEQLNKQAPVKRIQVKRKTTTFASIATQDIIKNKGHSHIT